jgi:hypothetical protein
MSQDDNIIVYDDNDMMSETGYTDTLDMDNYSIETCGKVNDHRFPGMNLIKNGKFKSNSNYIEYEPGHYTIFRIINEKRVPVEIYMTKNQPGYLIRNAISGIRETKYRVGRKDECLFFKVKLTDKLYGQHESYGVLFYDSPEEYERHFNISLQQGLKESWVERKMQYMQETSEYDTTEERDTMVIVH